MRQSGSFELVIRIPDQYLRKWTLCQLRAGEMRCAHQQYAPLLTRDSMFITLHCELQTTHCPTLLNTYHSLTTAHYSMLTTHCSLLTLPPLTPHSPLPTIHSPLPTPYCLLLTAHCSLPTVHCLLRKWLHCSYADSSPRHPTRPTRGR